MGCGAGVAISAPKEGFSTCVLQRNGSIFTQHGNSSMPPRVGKVNFSLAREGGETLVNFEVSCAGTEHERAFSFESTMSYGGANFVLKVAEPKESQGVYPIWLLGNPAGDSIPPFRVSGSFGQTCFTRITDEEAKVVASAMYLMDSLGNYTRDLFVFRGNIESKKDAEAKSRAPGNLLAFVQGRKSDENLPYQKSIVKEGAGSVQIADELLASGSEFEVRSVFMLIGIAIAGLDSGRRYYSELGPGSSGDGTGPTIGDQAWGSLIHE